MKINTSGGRSLLLMGGTVDDLHDLLPQRGLFIITDTNVSRIYGHLFPPAEVLVIEAGEKSKTLETVENLCRRMLLAGADRTSFILGFGGGVVCDVAGLTASLFMRGIRHGFVSTTLLSQVDASIGGKTGVNLGEYKNIIGTFRQPEFVLCDHSMLSTLPDQEFRSGLGEVFKQAAIRDRDLFFQLSESGESLAARDPRLLGDIILRSVRIKAAVVKRDPLERGVRRILNFGHTFGHVIETHYGIPHGIAVSQGMVIASELSAWKGEMPNAEVRILKLALDKAGLLPGVKLPANTAGKISKDKKGESGSLNLVMLKSIGKAIVRKLTITEIQEFMAYFNEKENESQSQ